MDYEGMMSVEMKIVENNMYLRDSKIRKILQLCMQPKSKIDAENILIKFRNKMEELSFISDSQNLWEFDVICMCVLDYIYENDSASLSAVLRCLCLYINQMQLPWLEDCRIAYIKCNLDCVLNELHQITDLHTYSKCENMLLDISLASILDGNLGLASFLVKFGLVELPNELNEKGKKMVEILVNRFNGSFHHPLRDIEPEEMRKPIEMNKLLNLMRDNQINFRRTLLTFCTIILISEYELYKEEEIDSKLNSFNETMKRTCHRKFVCLKLFIDTTTETKITLKDIENFIARFINSFSTADVGSTLIQASKEILCTCLDYYNPRSLKDLARCKIRANLQNFMTFPEQIKQFDIPNSLKEFLLFHREEIWLLLKLNFISNKTLKQLKLHASLTRVLHFYENLLFNALVNV